MGSPLAINLKENNTQMKMSFLIFKTEMNLDGM